MDQGRRRSLPLPRRAGSAEFAALAWTTPSGPGGAGTIDDCMGWTQAEVKQILRNRSGYISSTSTTTSSP